MVKISKGQISIILGAIVLLVGIMFLPKTAEQGNGELKTELNVEETDVESQIKMGISTVFNSTTPMQGIMILKGILDKDPDNVKAHFALGVLSTISRQYDKAKGRFQKVSENIELDQDAAKFLAKTCAEEGQQDLVIESLNQYIASADEDTVSKEVKELIKELKNI